MDDRTYAVLVGRTRLLVHSGQPLPAELTEAMARAQAEGRTAIAVGWNRAARGVLVVADAIKNTSAEAVTRLSGLGLHPILLTGDQPVEAGLHSNRRARGQSSVSVSPRRTVRRVPPKPASLARSTKSDSGDRKTW